MTNTDTAPLFEPPANPCLKKHGDIAFFIECVTADGRVYGFPYSHLSNYLLEPNPALEHSSEAPPERLSLWFSTHQVLILGWCLDEIRLLLRDGTSVTITTREYRYAHLQPKMCFVSEVAVLSARE